MTSRTASSEVPGWYVELQANVLRQLPRPGELDATTAQGWSQNQKALKKVLGKALTPTPKSNIVSVEQVDPYTVTVDYNMTVEEMIEAGHYGGVCDNYKRDMENGYYSIKGDGISKVTVFLVKFHVTYGYDMISDAQVSDFLDKLGFAIAKDEHLLAFGAKYPDLLMLKSSPVMVYAEPFASGIGSGTCPDLSQYGDFERNLRLHEFSRSPKPLTDLEFSSSCRFLAIRKSA